jgi:hypothetical protein
MIEVAEVNLTSIPVLDNELPVYATLDGFNFFLKQN